MTIGTKMGLGFGILLVLVATITAVVSVNLSNLHKRFTIATVNDALVMTHYRMLEKLTSDMEAGQRGFVITGEDEFLEPYNYAIKEFERIMDQQKVLVQKQPRQMRLLEKIENALGRWKTNSAEPEIAMRRKVSEGHNDATHLQEILAKGLGKGILDQMRQVALTIGDDFQIDGNTTGVVLTEKVMKAMVDQETGERGFLITGEDSFLEPYNQGQIDVKSSLSQLRALVEKAHDRPGTQSDLDELDRLHYQWIREAAEPEIQLRRAVASDSEPSEALTTQEALERGKSILDQMRTVMLQLSDRFDAAGNEKLQTLLGALAKSAVDQETGQRGFLITADEAFLEPYLLGVKEWKNNIAKLRALNMKAYDIKTMVRHIDDLEHLSAQWLVEAGRPEIAARRLMDKHPERLNDVVRMLDKGTGKIILAELDNLFEELVDNEQLLGAQRSSEAADKFNTTANTTISLAIASLLLGSIIAAKITWGITQPVNKLNGAFSAVIDGDLNQRLQIESHDQLGALSKSFNAMVKKLKQMQASNQDVTHQLQKNNINLELEVKRKDAHATLADLTRDVKDIPALSEIVISFLAQFSDSQVGTIYLHPGDVEESQTMDLCATYAIKNPHQLTKKISPGEGLAGQALLEHKPITARQIPDEYFKFSSSLGDASPSNLLVIPLIYRDKLKGVIELGSFAAYSDVLINELKTFTEVIARLFEDLQDKLRIATANSEIARLFEREKDAAKELEHANTQIAEALKQVENQKLALDEHAIVSIADIKGDILYVNEKFCELSGYTFEELIGQNHRMVKSDEHPPDFYREIWKTISGGQVWTGEIKNRAKDGSHYWVYATISPFTDESGQITQYVAIRTDITASKENEAQLLASTTAMTESLEREKLATKELKHVNEQLEELASTDKLTGLPNRALFQDRLTQTMKQTQRNGGRFAVLFFDFDRFKVVNDSLGHNVGDALLCDIADIFRRELRETDTVARFGGDEFVVLLSNLAHWSDAELKAQSLLEAFAQPHTLNGHLVVSTASIGLVTNEFSYESPNDIIRDADAALYQAKDNGKAQVVVFDQEMHSKAIDRLELESDLRIAKLRNEFRLMYQPIIQLDTGELVGFEALVRWEHLVHGMISPCDFIPLAEETGQIIDIGKWILKTAAAQVVDWNQRLDLDQKLSINVNISKRQLLDSSFLDDILACQKKYGFSSGDIKLEVTESVIADTRMDVVPLLKKLRDHGFPIIMDDFGTGVSSLGTLYDYPIDVLKIDQAFIRVLNQDRSLLAVVASITNLADNLGIQTVAEGIETEDIIGALQSVDCTWGQGYYFARPLSVKDAENFILDAQKDSKMAFALSGNDETI